MSDLSMRSIADALKAKINCAFTEEAREEHKPAIQADFLTISLGAGRMDGSTALACQLGHDNPSQTLVVFVNKIAQVTFQAKWKELYPGKAMPLLHYGPVHEHAPVIKRLIQDGVILDQVIVYEALHRLRKAKDPEVHDNLVKCTSFETLFYMLG